MSHLADRFVRPIDIADGDGCRLIAADGRRYIDFSGGWCVGTLGWKHPAITAAMKEEAERATYVPPYLKFSEAEALAERLCAIAPGSLARVYRCTSGSEAVEIAVKCARGATGKPTIVSVEHVYHGHTYGAASVGNCCRKGIEPCLPGFKKIPMPNAYRGVTVDASLTELRKFLKKGDVAAFISEPVWTNAGCVIPPADFYPEVQALCRKHDALLAMDEVATCFGRCGTLFGSELWGLAPDILCLGKGFTGGYASMAATLVTEKVYAAAEAVPIPSYSTFGWLPMDLAATRANVEEILRTRLWEQATDTGITLIEECMDLLDLPFVGDVRGIGLVIGIEIVTDKKSRTPDPARTQRIVDACADAGLIIEDAGGNVLFLTPPLALQDDLAREGAAILTRVVRSS